MKINLKIRLFTHLFAVIAAWCFSVTLAAAVPPDLTADPPPADHTHDWNLGAIGARGWIHWGPNNYAARQIYVTEVFAGSPAALGGIEVGDVILGVNDVLFKDNPRIEIGKALTIAESSVGGAISLMRWRDGAQNDVSLTIPKLGNYSPTAPFDCPKSTKIFDEAVIKLVEKLSHDNYRPRRLGIKPEIDFNKSIDALALLATGDPAHHHLVRARIEAIGGGDNWFKAYDLILMAEYALATGNTDFFDKMKALAIEVANSRTDDNTWGHHGRLSDGTNGPYGSLSIVSLPMTIGLRLSQMAGVDDPEVAAAITGSANVLRFYSGKGTVPYGHWAPNDNLNDDGGKSALACVLFDILGESTPATFFSKSAIASHTSERDLGHNGNYFSMLWAMPAVSRSGPHASGEWMKEFGSWYFDLARQWDGTFINTAGPRNKGFSNQGKTDMTGAYILAYSTHLKNIYMTGKRDVRFTASIEKLEPADALNVVSEGKDWRWLGAGDDFIHIPRSEAYREYTDDKLYAKLGSWSPASRTRAADALNYRYPKPQPRLIDLLDSTSSSLQEKLGACKALGMTDNPDNIDEIVGKLHRTLLADDLWLRVSAARALGSIGEPALRAVPDLVSMLGESADSVADPMQMEQRLIASALFGNKEGLLRGETVYLIEDVDSLVDAVAKALGNEGGQARNDMSLLFSALAYEQIQPLLPAIRQVVIKTSKAYPGQSELARQRALKVLADYGVEEGLQAGVDYMLNMETYKGQVRFEFILSQLERYGTHANTIVDQLEAYELYLIAGHPTIPLTTSVEWARLLRATIDRIKASTDTPHLVSITNPKDPIVALDASTLNGLNPATDKPWAIGDTYRLAFVTSETRSVTSTDINVYNAFVQDLAQNSTLGLGGLTWKVIGSTPTVDARDNTSLNPDTDGTNEPIYFVDGTTLLAANSSDIWDDGVTTPLNMDENGKTVTDVISYVFTGSSSDGTKVRGGFDPDAPLIGLGSIRDSGNRWVYLGAQPPSGNRRFYGLSDPITITAEDFPKSVPGLWHGTLPGAMNVLGPNRKIKILTHVASETENAIEEFTTEVFTGYIYDADGKISFQENIDSMARIKINGKLVIDDDRYSTPTRTPNLDLDPGWNRIEIRISREEGGSGSPRAGLGIAFDPNGGRKWMPLIDRGDGSLLRTEVPGEDVNFNNQDVVRYNAKPHDTGTATIGEGGSTLTITGNRWEAIEYPYTVTKNTVIEFNFQSNSEGDIHAIGFDNDLSHSHSNAFKLYGTQDWGRSDYNNYSDSAPEIKHYRIPVGEHYTGVFQYLFFVMDDDDNASGQSIFSNIRVYEAEPNRATMAGLWYGTQPGNLNSNAPNPQTELLLDISSKTEDNIAKNTTEIYTGQIYDADGIISFTEHIDDKARIWINGVLVLTDDNWTKRKNTIASEINPIMRPGWNDIEIRISNGIGGSGAQGNPGIGFDPAGGTDWRVLKDSGNGSLLRSFVAITEVPNFVQQDSGAAGLVSIEAEGYARVVDGLGKEWVEISEADASGGKAMDSTPDTGANLEPGMVKMEYDVDFVKTGIHYVWIRGRANPRSQGRYNADSVHAGLDAVTSSSDRISGFGTNYTWLKTRMGGADATINVNSVGVHIFSISMREDGFICDKIVLTTDVNHIPSEDVAANRDLQRLAAPAAKPKATPGLYYGILSGDINTTEPNPKTKILVNVASETENKIAKQTTEVYTGQIYDADGAISFTEQMNGKVRIWINGDLVINNNLWTVRSKTKNLKLVPGWNDIEIRISRGSRVSSGPRTKPGIGFDPKGGKKWRTLVDPGNGSLLRLGAPSITPSGPR